METGRRVRLRKGEIQSQQFQRPRTEVTKKAVQMQSVQRRMNYKKQTHEKRPVSLKGDVTYGKKKKKRSTNRPIFPSGGTQRGGEKGKNGSGCAF